MPDRLHFTGNDEADALLAQEPMALLIGFALDQQVPVPTAFTGPLKLKQRIGTLDAGRIAATDPADARGGLPREARDPPLPRDDGARASRSSPRSSPSATAGGRSGSGRRPPTPTTCARGSSELPGFGEMKIKALGSVLAEALRRRGCAGARARAIRRSATSTRPRRSPRYQAAKRAYKAVAQSKA